MGSDTGDQAAPVDCIAVVGLGYVGLPLAVAFGARYTTLGLDTDAAKIQAYEQGRDPRGEIPDEALQAACLLTYSTDVARLAQADVVIIAVPTPIDEAHHPDLTPLVDACKVVGAHMKAGVTVVFESTVYPGTTEEVCVPLLEQVSGLVWQEDFFVGYSPERVNPGDKEHLLASIIKVVAGDTPQTLARLSALYGSVIHAGVHRASSIKVAEAAKVIENTQRDLNIALMNEFAMIFNRLGIPTHEVLAAAGTKWNFLPFHPGLVGGHCIGVDPYYLTYKAQTTGYHPDVILAGRRLNDGMGRYIAEQTVVQLIQQGVNVRHARIGIFGLTFKENCSDLRNTRVVDIIKVLRGYGVDLVVHDPVADPQDAAAHYALELTPWDSLGRLDGAVLAVAHEAFVSAPLSRWLALLKRPAVVIDVKSMLSDTAAWPDDIAIWRL